MRIAYILPSLARFGPNIVIHSIISSEIVKGHEIVVYYFDEKKDVLYFDCPTHKIEMEDMIDFDYFDIIHSSMLRPDRYVYKNRRKIKKAQTITTIHQDIYSNLRSTYNLVISRIVTPMWLKYIAAFTVAVPISGVIKNLYSNTLSNLSPVIYNGVNVHYNPSCQEKVYVEQIGKLKKHSSIVLGTYAQITFIKGIDQIIDLVKYRTDISAVIIGEGNAKASLIRKVKDLRLGDRVLFLPYLQGVYNYLDGIDVYVMPSRSEGFGMAMVEAAFTKTPIVCSDICVFREIFDKTQASFFRLDDIVSMSEAVNNALMRKEYFVENSYNHALTHFSIETMAQQYLQLYMDLTEKK